MNASALLDGDLLSDELVDPGVGPAVPEVCPASGAGFDHRVQRVLQPDLDVADGAGQPGDPAAKSRCFVGGGRGVRGGHGSSPQSNPPEYVLFSRELNLNSIGGVESVFTLLQPFFFGSFRVGP